MVLILKDRSIKTAGRCRQCHKAIPAGATAIRAWDTAMDKVNQEFGGGAPTQERTPDHLFCSKDCADTWEAEVDRGEEED